jgi:hypothetical protein
MPGTVVEVDLDDLEALVFASAAIKQIEGTLVAYRRDPFTQDAAGRFVRAQKRLESVMRDARRRERSGETVIAYNDPLTAEEGAMLRGLVDRRDQFDYTAITVEEKLPLHDRQFSAVDQLAAKGMIEVGSYVYGGSWNGDDHPVIRIDPNRYMVRFTARGEAEVNRMRAARREQER